MEGRVVRDINSTIAVAFRGTVARFTISHNPNGEALNSRDDHLTNPRTKILMISFLFFCEIADRVPSENLKHSVFIKFVCIPALNYRKRFSYLNESISISCVFEIYLK